MEGLGRNHQGFWGVQTFSPDNVDEQLNMVSKGIKMNKGGEGKGGNRGKFFEERGKKLTVTIFLPPSGFSLRQIP